MLRSSSELPGASRAAVRLLLAVGLLAVAGTLPAQRIATTALLEIGPQARRGIDALAPDVTPHWYGRYAVAGASVDLIFVRAPLAEPSAWPQTPCVERRLRSTDGRLHYYEHPAGWSVLVAVSLGELPPGLTVCRFVDRFVDRHLAFENLEQVRTPGSAPVFPAVMEL